MASRRSVGEREAFVEPQLLLEAIAAEAERGLGARPHLGLEVLDVARRRPAPLRSTRRRDRPAGADRRGCENARGRSRSMNVMHAAQRVDADLDEDGRRLLDVVARRLNRAAASDAASTECGGRDRPRGRSRRSPARRGSTPGCRRRPAGCAPSRASLPARTGGPACSPRRCACSICSVSGSGVDGNVVEAPREPGQRARRCASSAGRPEVLEEVVVQVDAVHRGAGRVRLVQVIQVVVDKVREGFGGVHRSPESFVELGSTAAGRICDGPSAVGGTSNRTIESADEGLATHTMPGVAMPPVRPARSSSSRRRSATSRTSRSGRCGSCGRSALVAAEDTRRTANLLRHYQIRTPLSACTSTTSAVGSTQLLERSAAMAGQLPLFRDAGTPGISDPGRTHRPRPRATAGFRVEPIPGPSAVTAALSVSGLDATGLRFSGFHQPGSRSTELVSSSIDGLPDVSVVCFEAPHRMADSARSCAIYWVNDR